MKATQDLMDEHRGIERMLNILEAAAKRLESGAAVPPAIFEQAVDFVRTFADKCHHGKEEQHLFPAMEKAGVPRQGGPIGVMLTEHEQGRAFVRSLAAAVEQLAKGDAAAKKAVSQAALGYVGLLRNHIYKEDNILFPLAARVVPTSEHAGLAQAFDHVEEVIMGPGVHERYHAMLDDLEKVVAAW